MPIWPRRPTKPKEPVDYKEEIAWIEIDAIHDKKLIEDVLLELDATLAAQSKGVYDVQHSFEVNNDGWGSNEILILAVGKVPKTEREKEKDAERYRKSIANYEKKILRHAERMEEYKKKKKEFDAYMAKKLKGDYEKELAKLQRKYGVDP